MTRTSATDSAAKRRRAKHERRIAEQANPLDRLAQLCSWLRSEAIRAPHRINHVIDRVHTIVVDLNEGRDQ